MYSKLRTPVAMDVQAANNAVLRTCAACRSQGPRYRTCGGCRAVHYCSPTCQMNHWTWHRDHCKPNKRVKYEGEDAQRQLPLSRDASGNGEPSVASADGHYPVRAVVLLLRLRLRRGTTPRSGDPRQANYGPTTTP